MRENKLSPERKAKWYHISYLFSLNLGIVSLLLLVLGRFGLLNVELIFSLNWFFAIAIFSLTASLILRYELNLKNEKQNIAADSIFQISPYFFLSVLFILAVNQFLKLDFITARSFHLTIFGIAFGFLSFYRNRDRVERELESEKLKEEADEEKRREEFGGKFPRVARIWGVRRLVRWAYKEGWYFSIPFVIITIVFIAIKIGMPLVYTGSYIDEYNHILSGIEFFKTGHFAEVYKGEYYNNGSHVSFLVGVFMYVFGKTIFIAKLLPAIVGIINFFLLYGVAKRILVNKTFTLLLLSFYAISPWVIFNHFYIRTYVFFEFLFLFCIFMSFLITNSINLGRKVKTLYYVISFLVIGVIFYFFSFDISRKIVVSLGCLFFLWVILIKFNINKKLKAYFFVALIFILAVFGPLPELGYVFGSGTVTDGQTETGYYLFFFLTNSLMTVLFLLAPILCARKKDVSFFIIVISIGLFFLYLFSTKEFQVIRAILGFLPVYFMISFYSLERIKLFRYTALIIICVLLLSIASNYPIGFFSSGPYLPKEITYREYKSASEYILENSDGNTVLITTNPQVNLFYGLNNTETYLIRQTESSYYDLRLKYKHNNMSYYTITNTEIIENEDRLRNVLLGRQVFIFVDRSLYAWIDPESKKIITEDFIVDETNEGVDIWAKRN